MKSKYRSICLLIGFVILSASASVLFIPQLAEASVPAHEWSLTGPIPTPMTMSWMPCKELSLAAGLGCPGSGLTQFIPGWDSLGWMVAKAILHEFSQQVVQWIRTGQSPFFSGGTEGRLFVTNIDQFLLSAADNAASTFLRDYFGPAWDSLCTPFRLQVGIGLSRSYGRGYGSFGPKARCSITDIVENLEDFYGNFQNGGWQAWVATSRYENNAFGLVTLSVYDSFTREHRAVSANLNDFLAGLGFPGLRECTRGINPVTKKEVDNPTLTPGPDGTNPLCTKYVTKTPGKAIEDQVANVYGQEWRNLGMADEINEILFASFRSLLSWILSGGSDEGLFGADVGSAPPPGGGGNCSSNSGRGFGCSCTINTQCSSNFCSPTTNTCSSPSATTQCNDGIDNDGDRLIDFPADPGCTSSADTSENDTVPPPPPPPPPPPGVTPPPPPPPPPAP